MRFVHALLHARLNHAVAILDRLENRDDASECFAPAFLERQRLQRDVSRHSLEFERSRHPLGRRISMMDAVKSKLVAFCVAVDEAPSSAITQLEAVHSHREIPRTEPLHQK